MQKEKVLVVGAFGYEKNQLDGQTIKTRNVYNLLQKKHEGEHSYIDTLSLRKKPWLGFVMLYRLVTCNTLIILLPIASSQTNRRVISVRHTAHGTTPMLRLRIYGI